MNESNLNKNIAELRKAAGLTQEALAGKLGLSYQAVSKWENAQSCPDVLLLPKLAEIFAAHGALDKLQGFVSSNACNWYGLQPVQKQITLRDTSMTVPASYRSYGEQVVPMYAGESIGWSVVR